MRVLIVEDEVLIALELERIAKDAGHDVIGPVSGLEQALAYAGRADAALVDLGLSDGESGPRLARRLMDQFGIQVVFVTGSPRDVGFGLEGSIDVVSKPLSDERIVAALNKAARQTGGIDPSTATY